MLLIFDLDDTLIDTSGTLTPWRLACVLRALVHAGHPLPTPFEESLQTLLQINERADSSQAAVQEFIEVTWGPACDASLCMQQMQSDLPDTLSLSALDGAMHTLVELGRGHTLALVSAGREALQVVKMKKAGIDSSVFSKMIFSERGGKGAHYLALLEAYQHPPSRALVCGDRVAVDLAPAKELGCHTVHMLWGRGRRCVVGEGVVDHSISQLEALIHLVASYDHE